MSNDIGIEDVVICHPLPNKPLFFTCLQYKSFENTVRKGEIARNEQFLLLPLCFFPAIFIKILIVARKLFQFGRVLNLLFGKGLTTKEKIVHLCMIDYSDFLLHQGVL